MSYALALTPEAEEDLANLIDSLPRKARREGLDAVEAALQKLAANPGLAARGILGRPTYRFGFKASHIGHHWAATFKYSEDERSIVITQLYRVAL